MGAIGDAALIALGDAAPQGIDDRLERLMAVVQPADGAQPWRKQSLGAVTRAVLNARVEVIGETLECVATCPDCAESMSMEVTVSELCVALTPPATVQIRHDGIAVVGRAPTASDLAVAASQGSFGAARQSLIESCIVAAAKLDGTPIPIADLAAAAIDAIGRAIDEADPLVDPSFALTCPECNDAFSASLDAASLVYGELAARGAELLYQVDALALRYGWSESEILSLSASRRDRYLELAR